MMRSRLMLAALAALLAVAVAPLASAQLAAVKGKVTDEQGQPIVKAVVEYVSNETGHKYKLETDTKGDYFSIGIQPGTYRVNLYRSQEDLKADKTLFFFNNVQVLLARVDGVNLLDIDLAKERARGGAQMSEEERRQHEEVKQENVKIKSLNDLLAQSKEAQDAGNTEQAIALLQQAVGIDATKDVLWARLGIAYAAGKRYPEAADAYQKAIAIKPTGAYYNNLGEALAKSGKVADAAAAYNTAAQMDPVNSGMYFFNLGATYVNSNRLDEALAAFDKCIAADPSRADAYYQKGTILIGKGSSGADNKFVAPPGTAEAFNKVIELQPDSPLAAQAKLMLEFIGSEVQTSYKKVKPTKK